MSGLDEIMTVGIMQQNGRLSTAEVESGRFSDGHVQGTDQPDADGAGQSWLSPVASLHQR